MTPIQSTSSQIKEFSYDAEAQTLLVTFRSGGSYSYAEVLEDKFNEMQAAESHGKFLASRIKPYHKAQKVAEKLANEERNS